MEEQSVSGNTTYPALVGNIIASLRKERGIGQAEFSAMVGVGQSTWSRIEKGQSALTVEQLAKAAQQLEMRPHQLLALVDGARDNLQAQGIGTLLDRIGAGNMALLGSIPVVGPTLTAVLSGISTYREYSSFQQESLSNQQTGDEDQEIEKVEASIKQKKITTEAKTKGE
jgi:transcriptional regulator with XRE-family HTH domain